ncbi:MAG: bifunctional phosphopantothenoylcysteine decarboxylase/phosphopantothenate--cysteine ligase CoaBC [Candidatus Nanopelagicales bacterium]|nr:bifunctional phosphopantothenoylcysteine decarboxylase/phosphopantothenate--cysteine ligase CoaBC [Candidatus Nanopelagicales bacterium]
MLGVGGGIAAYKAAHLLRLLTEAGHEVRVVPTEAALQFVGRATWAALSGQPVHTSVWDDVEGVGHVRVGKTADLVVVAPATADLLARAVAGRADDLLTATLLTATCPVLMVPAMHTEMWQHPATVANVATLRERGILVLDPAVGRLTGADTGPGRLPEPEAIAQAVHAALHTGGRRDLAGLRVVVSAGGTREPVDPVRFLGNRSSGLQGYALAAAAAARGAEVTLVSANVALVDPAGVRVVPVGTALELEAAVGAAAAAADVVVMAAAVADFRPAEVAADKIKKGAQQEPAPIALVRNPDVLAGLVAARRSGTLPATTTLVGFAAETGDADADALQHARAKLASKGVDLLVANDVAGGAVFGRAGTVVHLLTPDGAVAGPIAGAKAEVAHAVWDRVAGLRAATT